MFQGIANLVADTLACTCLIAVPPIAQPGDSPAAPPDKSQVVATFDPPRPGRPVILQKRTRRGWRVVAHGQQGRLGAAAFDVRRGQYRARVPATRWRPAKTTDPVSTTRWRLDFEETFSGNRLDASVWNDQVRPRESVHSPRTCARSSSMARRVSRGVMHLGVREDPQLSGVPCFYTHALQSLTHDFLLYSQVATEHTRAFRFGTFAVRMKLQRSPGMHSAFWLLPVDRAFVPGDPTQGTEVDIVEFFGRRGGGSGTIGSFVHYYDSEWNDVKLGALWPRASKVLDAGEKWWDEFHVFSVEWSPTAYVFRVDGREYHRETQAVSQVAQYLVLSMIPADYELHRLSRKGRDDTAQVDWVRVYGATP